MQQKIISFILCQFLQSLLIHGKLQKWMGKRFRHFVLGSVTLAILLQLLKQNRHQMTEQMVTYKHTNACNIYDGIGGEL